MANTVYSATQRAFHWVIALLVIGNLAGALIADSLGEESEVAKQIMGLHTATGMLILMLVVLRLANRLASAVPPPLDSWPQWVRVLSRLGHGALYVMLLVMPVTGYLLVTGHGHAVDFYGLFEFPRLLGENETLAETSEEIHEIIGWVLLITVIGHAGFALKHHFVDGDETLKRMIGKR